MTITPLETKRPATLTAWLRNPPDFSLRSNTRPKSPPCTLIERMEFNLADDTPIYLLISNLHSLFIHDDRFFEKRDPVETAIFCLFPFEPQNQLVVIRIFQHLENLFKRCPASRNPIDLNQ